jgi:dUTP pyrophosphatase
MPVLSGNDIRRLIKATPPLVEGCVDVNAQVQPNGIDLTLRDISAIKSQGQIAADNKRRVLPDLSPLAFSAEGFIELAAGSYIVTYNEVVHLPKNVMALGRPRSSLLRCGVDVGTAVWDAGYEGRSQSLLMVHNPLGFRLEKNARIMQLVFMDLTGESEGYKGIYQNENT